MNIPNQNSFWTLKKIRRGTQVRPIETFTDRQGYTFHEYDVFVVKDKGMNKLHAQCLRDKTAVMIYEEDFHFMNFKEPEDKMEKSDEPVIEDEEGPVEVEQQKSLEVEEVNNQLLTNPEVPILERASTNYETLANNEENTLIHTEKEAPKQVEIIAYGNVYIGGELSTNTNQAVTEEKESPVADEKALLESEYKNLTIGVEEEKESLGADKKPLLESDDKNLKIDVEEEQVNPKKKRRRRKKKRFKSVSLHSDDFLSDREDQEWFMKKRLDKSEGVKFINTEETRYWGWTVSEIKLGLLFVVAIIAAWYLYSCFRCFCTELSHENMVKVQISVSECMQVSGPSTALDNTMLEDRYTKCYNQALKNIQKTTDDISSAQTDQLYKQFVGDILASRGREAAKQVGMEANKLISDGMKALDYGEDAKLSDLVDDTVKELNSKPVKQIIDAGDKMDPNLFVDALGKLVERGQEKIDAMQNAQDKPQETVQNLEEYKDEDEE